MSLHIIGKYGTDPANVTASAVSTTAVTTTSPWGFSTSTQGDAVVTLVNDLRTKLDAMHTDLYGS